MTRRIGGVLGAWMAAFWLVAAGPWASAQAATPGQPGAKLPEGVKALRGVEFAKVGGKSLQLDIYTPTEPKGKLPLVVWIFGGAWRGGSKEHGPGFNAIGVVVPHGYVMACISHRFSQDAIFPAQIEDCKAAIRFLRANAAKYSIDGDHIGVWGESSGGHLSARLGTSGDVKDLEGQVGDNLGVSSRVQCVVDYCGPSDFMKFAGRPTWVKVDDPKSPVCQLVGGLLADKKALVAKANPITYITKDDPPLLVAHGDKDNAVPFNQSELLVDALKRAGVDVTFEAIKGGGHNFGQAQYERLVPIVIAFFDKHLKGAAATPQDTEKAAN